MSRNLTWFVVADGGKARILTKQDNEMRTLHRLASTGHAGTDEDPGAGGGQAKAPRTDPHEQAKVQFAKQVAERLNEAVRAQEVDHIVIAAPAHVLHDIREGLDKAASGKVGQCLSKDLTNTPDHQLASHFA